MGKIEKHFSSGLATLDASSDCRTAARLMRDRKIGAVVVLDGERAIGLVTERDLAWRVLASEGPVHLPLAQVMRHDLPTVGPGASELECAQLMRQHNTRHLLVTDGDRTLGIISMRDVIQLMLDEKQYLIDQLQHYLYQT
jgi:CBS domain-containing protein